MLLESQNLQYIMDRLRLRNLTRFCFLPPYDETEVGEVKSSSPPFDREREVTTLAANSFKGFFGLLLAELSACFACLLEPLAFVPYKRD